MDSIFTLLPEFKTDKVAPETASRVAVGAASPLWLMFGGAAMAGASYWWWANRWREAVNLEAMIALAPEPVAPDLEAQAVLDEPPGPMVEAALEPAAEAVALAADTVETVMDAAEQSVEAVTEAVADTIVAANEDVVEAAVELTAEAGAPDLGPAAERPAEPAVEAADDLTQLVGVGPKLAASLAELGVTRFSQIAAWTPDELASFDQLLNLKGRADRDAWIAQAKRLTTPAQA